MTPAGRGAPRRVPGVLQEQVKEPAVLVQDPPSLPGVLQEQVKEPAVLVQDPPGGAAQLSVPSVHSSISGVRQNTLTVHKAA